MNSTPFIKAEIVIFDTTLYLNLTTCIETFCS